VDGKSSEKARSVAASAKRRAEAQVHLLHISRLATTFGKTVYEKHGKDRGPSELIEPIFAAERAIHGKRYLANQNDSQTLTIHSATNNQDGVTSALTALLLFTVFGSNCVANNKTVSLQPEFAFIERLCFH
jgi:hypothetical protein